MPGDAYRRLAKDRFHGPEEEVAATQIYIPALAQTTITPKRAHNQFGPCQQ